jgi:toxin CptA
VFSLGVVFIFGGVADLSLLIKLICASVCCVSAVAGFVQMLRNRQIYRLDISGVGQIRLSKALPRQSMTGDPTQIPAFHDEMLVTLLADSTIWPGLLMLRLKAADGHLYNVTILPDSLPPESFRAVAVACRWIAGHAFKD